MIKKIIEISGDFILFFAFLGIILVSFVSVLTLSPINAENFGYNEEKKTVLGVNNSSKKLLFESNYEENSYFKVKETNLDVFSQSIEVGPMSEEKYIKDIFVISNPDSISREFKITFQISEESAKLADFGINYNNEDYILVDRFGGEKTLSGVINNNSTANFRLIIDPNTKINFKLNLTIFVEEVIKSFDLPN